MIILINKRIKVVFFILLLSNLPNLGYSQVDVDPLDSNGFQFFVGAKVKKLNQLIIDKKIEISECGLKSYKVIYASGMSFLVNDTLIVVEFKKRIRVKDSKIVGEVNENCLNSRFIRKSRIKSVNLFPPLKTVR